MKMDTEENPMDEPDAATFGQRLAENVAARVGSWKFILGQTAAIAVWVGFNVTGMIRWDIYPFILLNLFMSLQAAYTAPMILMSQNRQNEKDRKILYGDYEMDRETVETLRRVERKLDELLKLGNGT